MFHCVRWQCLAGADWTENLCLCFPAKFYPRSPTASGSLSSCLTESGSLALTSPALRNLINSDRDSSQPSVSQNACRVNSGKCHVLVVCLSRLGHGSCRAHWGIKSNLFHPYVFIIRKLFLMLPVNTREQGVINIGPFVMRQETQLTLV